MMKIVICTIALLFGGSFASASQMDINDIEAFALGLGIEEGTPDHGGGQGRGYGACKKMKLTPEQRTQIQTAYFELRKKRVTAKAQMKVARLDFEQAVLTETTQMSEIETITNKMSEVKKAMVGDRMQFQSDLYFNILNFSQRAPALRCMKKMRRMMRNRNGRRGGEGRHPGRRPGGGDDRRPPGHP